MTKQQKIGVIPVETDGGVAVNMQISEADIFVTGPMSSGTRLVCRIMEAGGFKAVHDSLHGMVQRPAKCVIVVVRNPVATKLSMEKTFKPDERISFEDSLKGAIDFYPQALWISYDQLCEAPDDTIKVIADWLGVDTWNMPEQIVKSPNSVAWRGVLKNQLARSTT